MKEIFITKSRNDCLEFIKQQLKQLKLREPAFENYVLLEKKFRLFFKQLRNNEIANFKHRFRIYKDEIDFLRAIASCLYYYIETINSSCPAIAEECLKNLEETIYDYQQWCTTTAQQRKMKRAKRGFY